MIEVLIEKISGGEYHLKVNGKLYSIHSGEEGAVSMGESILKRHRAIERNQELRSWLQGLHSSFSPDVDHSTTALGIIIQENQFLQDLANNLGIYTGQPESED